MGGKITTLIFLLVAVGIPVQSLPSLSSDADVEVSGVAPESGLDAQITTENDDDSLRKVRGVDAYETPTEDVYNKQPDDYQTSYDEKPPEYNKPEKEYYPEPKKEVKKKKTYKKVPAKKYDTPKYKDEQGYDGKYPTDGDDDSEKYDAVYADKKHEVESLNKKYKALVDAIHRLDKFYRPCEPSGVEKSGLCLAWEKCTRVVAHDDPCLYDISVACSKYRPACIVDTTLTCQNAKCPTACVEVESMRCDEVCIGGPNRKTFKLTCPPTPYCLPPPKTKQKCPLLEPAKGHKVFAEEFKAPVKKYPPPSKDYEVDNKYPTPEKPQYGEEKPTYGDEKAEYEYKNDY